MIERALAALVLVAVIAAAMAGARWLLRRRDRRIVRRLRAEQHDPAPNGAAPRILYFTTTSCVVCRAQQEPAIEVLRRELPDLVVDKHDAVAEQALAKRYGVLTVPTTVVFDRDGGLVTINRGFTPAAALLAQVRGAEPALEGGASMDSERVE